MLSLTDPRFPFDRYAVYRELHEGPAVAWDDGAHAFLLSRYDDVMSALRSPAFSSRRVEAMTRGWSDETKAEMRPLTSSLNLWMLFQDPPDHTRLRAIMTKAFTPRIVEALRPRIEVLVAELLDAAAARGGGIDVVADLAFPLPATVILEMLGIPAADRDRFKAWSNDIARLIGGMVTAETSARAKRSLEEMGDYFAPLFADRRASPRDDLISGLLAATDRSDLHGNEELLANCVMLMFGGHETTTNLIGNGVLALLDHPVERARWTANPSLAAGAIDELLRYETPVQMVRRALLEPIDVGGVAMPKDALAVLLLGAANRDARAFPEPDRLDVGRKPRHTAFGLGTHFCIGAALARAEAEIAIGALFRRHPELRRAPGTELRWHPSVALRSLVALDVVA